MTKSITPDEPGTFARGVSVTPPDQLLAWFESQKRDGQPRLMRIPVLLGSGVTGFSTANCKIGATPDALTVFLDDSALGIGIADRARSCKGQPVCAMWLEGYWQGKDDAGDYAFRVMKFHGLIAAGDIAAANYAEVEAPSPRSN